MGSRLWAVPAVVMLGLASITVAGAASKTANRALAPTSVFVTQAEVHTFLVEAPVKHTYVKYAKFSGAGCGRSSFPRSGWAAGVMERFLSLNTQNQLTICAATYRSSTATHRAYLDATSQHEHSFIYETSVTPAIGDESASAYTMTKLLLLPQSSFFFRNGATLVGIKVLGQRAIGVDVTDLAQRLDSKLGT